MEARMEEAPILVERREGYRVITLNRPRYLNAFTETIPIAAAPGCCRGSSVPPARAASRSPPSRLPFIGFPPLLAVRHQCATNIDESS